MMRSNDFQFLMFVACCGIVSFLYSLSFCSLAGFCFLVVNNNMVVVVFGVALAAFLLVTREPIAWWVGDRLGKKGKERERKRERKISHTS